MLEDRGTIKYRTYEGFETFFNNLLMTLKMIFIVSILGLLIHLIGLLLLIQVFYKDYEKQIIFTWTKAQIIYKIKPNYVLDLQKPNGEINAYTADEIVSSESVKNFIQKRKARFITIFVLSFMSYLSIPVMFKLLKKRSVNQSDRKYIRGSKLLTSMQFLDEARKNKDMLDLPFGGVRMPKNNEPEHTIIFGAPGAGKTTLLSQIIARLRERNAKCIIHDPKGDYLEKFYDPKNDLIFNPIDERSLGWNIFNEIKNYTDIEAIATSLIPPAENQDRFWNDGGRDVFAGILHVIKTLPENLQINKNIWQMVTSDTSSIYAALNKVTGGERGKKYIEKPELPQAQGVISVLMQYAKCFEYMQYINGDFSAQDWLTNRKGGCIFVSNYSDIKDALKPILSLFIDLLGRRLLALSDDRERRIFFILDEFGSLQKLSTIVDLLKLSRSKGGCCFISSQDIGQLDEVYTKDNRITLINACNSSAYFKVNDEVTAKHCSDKMGETEYILTQRTYSMGVRKNRDGTSLSEQQKKDSLFLPSEIMNLRKFEMIVKFGEYYPVLTKLEEKFFKGNNQAFIRSPNFEIKEGIKDKKQKDIKFPKAIANAG